MASNRSNVHCRKRVLVRYGWRDILRQANAGSYGLLLLPFALLIMLFPPTMIALLKLAVVIVSLLSC